MIAHGRTEGHFPLLVVELGELVKGVPGGRQKVRMRRVCEASGFLSMPASARVGGSRGGATRVPPLVSPPPVASPTVSFCALINSPSTSRGGEGESRPWPSCWKTRHPPSKAWPWCRPLIRMPRRRRSGRPPAAFPRVPARLASWYAGRARFLLSIGQAPVRIKAGLERSTTIAGLFDDLKPTPAERKLIQAAAKGRVANMSARDSRKNDPSKGASWGAGRTIRAEVLASLVTEARADWPVDPNGIAVVGARFIGELNLQGAVLKQPVFLERCFFEGQIVLMDASTRSLGLAGSIVPGINAERLHVNGALLLRDGFTSCGEVRLVSARIEGDLACQGSVFINSRPYPKDLARISQTHLGGVSSGADEPGCGSICVALRQSGPGLIV